MITVQIRRLGCGRIPTASTPPPASRARTRALRIALERQRTAVQNLGQSSSPLSEISKYGLQATHIEGKLRGF
jgi:hypothetical protein